MSYFYNHKHNVINTTLRILLPIYAEESNKKRKIIVSDPVINKSFYLDIGNVYGSFLLQYNYGISSYSSSLFINTLGANRRTSYIFFRPFIDAAYVSSLFRKIDKILYSNYISFMKKKISSNSY